MRLEIYVGKNRITAVLSPAQRPQTPFFGIPSFLGGS
jgi:hypothetical protein